MQLGVMDYIVADADEAATFGRARRLGFAGVELDLRRAQLRDPARAALDRLKQAQAHSGLQVPSLCLGELNRGGTGGGDPAVAREASEDIRHAIEWAAELGARVILVPFFGPAELVSDQQIARASAAFRQLCAAAQARGVALCYEGQLPAAAIRRMADQIDSPAFGCYFDLANVVARGMDTAAEIRGLGALIRQVHMKDVPAGGGNCQLGLGQVDFAGSAAALREIGYDGWLVLETPAAPDDVVARDISFTRRHFPQIA